MKHYLLIIFVFSSTVDAQNNLTIIGGHNLSWIKYNNDTFDEMMDINILRRNNFGIEIRFKKYNYWISIHTARI